MVRNIFWLNKGRRTLCHQPPCESVRVAKWLFGWLGFVVMSGFCCLALSDGDGFSRFLESAGASGAAALERATATAAAAAANARAAAGDLAARASRDKDADDVELPEAMTENPMKNARGAV